MNSRITKRFHKACADYALIEDGDHILVGLSGGKDSLALVQLLGNRSRIYVPRFRVTAAHVRVNNIGYASDTEYLRQFCEAHNVEFREVTTHYDEQEAADGQKNHCFLCSWYRRKALFQLAQEIGCNKLALGHHKDDIVQTLLMNIVNQGAFATMPPRLKLEKMPLTIIRPLCLIEEKDLVALAEEEGYRRVPKLCPYEHDSSRKDVKGLVASLEALNPNAKDSIWGAMTNIQPDYLPRPVKSTK